MEPTLLSERLSRLADRTAPPPRADLAEAVAARARAARRQTAGLLAVAAAVTAVVVAVPQLVDRSPAVPVPGHVAGPSSSSEVLSGPARGTLAGDAAFVDAVRGLSWTQAADPDAPTAQAEPPLETRSVVFAGDVPGGRWALVAAPDPSGTAGTAALWFAGPAGAPADRLQPVQLSMGLDTRTPVALTDAATGTLVVVAAPGDVVSVSRGPGIAADATVSRTWEDVDAPDGVAVTTLPTTPTMYDEGIRYRVTRDGAEVSTALPPGFRTGAYAPAAVSLSWTRTPADPAVTAALAGAATDTLTRTGLAPEDVAFEVVWSGGASLTGDAGVRLSLLSATLPSGAAYTEAWLTRGSGAEVQLGALCGSELDAAGTSLTERTFSVRCDDPAVLVVVGPDTAVGARVLDEAGEPVSEYDLDGGVALVPAPPGAATVQTLGADGGVRVEPALMGRVDLGRA